GQLKDHVKVDLVLYRDGVATNIKPDSIWPEGPADEFTYKWDNLKKYNNSGKEYVYTVKEKSVPEDYEVEYSKDNLTVINTYIKSPNELKITKTVDKREVIEDSRERVTYTIKIKNISDGIVKDVDFSDNMPNLLENIKVVVDEDDEDNVSFEIVGNKVTGVIDELKKNEEVEIKISGTLKSSDRAGDIFKNIVIVEGKETESGETKVVDRDDISGGYIRWNSSGKSNVVLNKGEHFGYLIGYPDGTIRPEGRISRAEVSTIFFRMMTDDSRNSNWNTTNEFNDVRTTDWYNNAISTLSKAEAVTGYPDGSFKPNAKITRGEFATMASRFLSETGELTDYKFTDTKGNWAEEAISKLASKGLIKGYEDGSFRPDQEITRAEAATLMNAVLERAPHKDNLLSNMKRWTDNTNSNSWYYAQIQEATNSHTFTRESINDFEIWRELLSVRNWVQYEKEWSNTNSTQNLGEVIDNR
ncbi:S-layer homology domain-containing protein, partial [Anaerosphaera multitolerans]